MSVRREELRIDREDVAPGEVEGRASTAMPFEIVLHEERLVVDRIVANVDVITAVRHERVAARDFSTVNEDDGLLPGPRS